MQKLITYRLPIILGSLLITLMSAFLLPRLEISPDLSEYVPDHLENKRHLRELDSIFGSTEMIIVMLQAEDVLREHTLARLSQLKDSLEQVEGIGRCITPFDSREISMEGGFMRMDPLFEDLNWEAMDLEAFRARVASNQMASRFFSDDFSLVSLLLTKDKKAPESIVEEIHRICESVEGEEEVVIGGLPFILYSISGNIRKDMVLLVPLALLLMVGMLYFFFREWKGVILPFLIVSMSILISFGVMALLGWKISLISILMPIMLISIANDYGIHMIARYQELLQGNGSLDMKQISIQIYRDLRYPIMVTGLTTIGGILGLLTHSMVPAAQLGVLTAVGIAFALLLSIFFLPALLSYYRLPAALAHNRDKKKRWAERWLNRFARWVSHHPKLILKIAGVATIAGVLGVLLIRVDTNIEGYFLGKSEVRRSTELINEQFGGSQFISILFEGDALDPDLLRRMEGYEQALAADPVVGSTSSAVTLIKELSKGFYDPDELGYDRLPDSGDEAYQFLEVFAMGGNEEAIEQFMDYEYRYSRIIVSLQDASNRAGKDLKARIQELTEGDPDLKFIAGNALTKIELADLVVKGQVRSLAFAMVVIFILLSLIFRSPRAGLWAALPLTIAIVILFGIMGYLGISLDIATALLSSIMVGVGVDYTIHFLWRFREERRRGVGHAEAASITLVTAGRGIFFNALSVIIGFLALGISNFAPLRYFSGLVVISIGSCLICALLLIPAIVVLLKPKFLDS